jgi:hypothetical protein
VQAYPTKQTFSLGETMGRAEDSLSLSGWLSF